jgi:tetratricopeptide (TPR) repeat protein
MMSHFDVSGQAQNYLLMGEYSRALELLQKAEDMVEEANVFDKYYVSGLLALAYYKYDEAFIAEQLCEEMINKLAGCTPMTCLHFESLASCIRLRLFQLETTMAGFDGVVDKPKATTAVKNAELALKVFSRFSSLFPVAQARLQAYQGLFAHLKGNKDNAYRLWKLGIGAARAHKMKYEEGLCFHLMANYPLPQWTREDINDHSSRANEIFQECGVLSATFGYRVNRKILK